MKSAMPIDNDILSEALLKYQIERIDAKYQSIEECNEQMNPNEKTEEKINKLIQLEQKPYFVFINTVGKRVACFVIVIFLALTTTVFSVKALREPFLGFIVESYEKFSTIAFRYSETQSAKSAALTQIYEPTYVPEGFTKTDEKKLSLSYFCEYKNNNGELFTFEQSKNNGSLLNIDTENTETEKMYINKYEAIFFENKGFNTIIFSDDKYGFVITGNISKTELIQVAESIEKNN